MAAAARPDIHAVIDARTLAAWPRTPPTSPGSDPSPPTSPGRLAAQGRWRLPLTDPARSRRGRVVAHLRPSAAVARPCGPERPPAAGRAAPAAREACDLDHTIAYPDGATTPANLGPLCRRHHNLKTHHGYVLTNPPPPDDRQREPGNGDDPPARILSTAWRWTTPAGLTHTRQPTQPPSGRIRMGSSGA